MTQERAKIIMKKVSLLNPKDIYLICCNLLYSIQENNEDYDFVDKIINETIK